jgi:hypothetical protein
MYYDYRQDEDYLARQDEDAQFSFINGQNGALDLLSPQEPNDDYYMMGWRDTKRQLASGQLCRACSSPQQPPTPEDWEEF